MPYITAAQVRTRYPELKDAGVYASAEIEGLIAEFEEIAEDYRGVAFTPRATVTESHYLDGQRYLRTSWPKIRGVTSITVAYLGSSISVGSTVWQIDAEAGLVDLGANYTGAATIVYAHGYDAPPQRVLNACYEYVRSVLLRRESGTARDVAVQGGDQSGTRYITPNAAEGRPTGYTEPDRLLTSVTDWRGLRNLG